MRPVDGKRFVLLGRALAPVERWFGAQVTEQIRRHHQRRLLRVGWAKALEPPADGWAAGEPPPRPGNAVEILIDGAQALPLIADELRGAHSHVHLSGWHFSPEFALKREDLGGEFREYLRGLKLD